MGGFIDSLKLLIQLTRGLRQTNNPVYLENSKSFAGLLFHKTSNLPLQLQEHASLNEARRLGLILDIALQQEHSIVQLVCAGLELRLATTLKSAYEMAADELFRLVTLFLLRPKETPTAVAQAVHAEMARATTQILNQVNALVSTLELVLQNSYPSSSVESLDARLAGVAIDKTRFPRVELEPRRAIDLGL